MSTGKLLGVEYLNPGELASGHARGWRDVLGVAIYAAADAPLDAADVPLARVAIRPLGAAPVLCEVWRADGPLTTGRVGLVHYRASRAVVFGCVSLGEAGNGADVATGAALAKATARAYAEVFRCLQTLGITGAIRIWNFLPEINREVAGTERYRIFNEARQRAFQASSRSVRGNVPAACALGSPAGGALVVYFLAGSEPATAIENPRQVSAYDYPTEYGVYSPTFSRATLAPGADGPMLFVSGTASIVGHRTAHAGDVVAQTRETVANIRALVAQANRAAGGELFAAERLRYKAYVRHAADVAAVAAEFFAAVQPAAPVLYLNADICREDLLVEFEAVGSAAPGPR
jgi:enamine deaminase RidA (YjgF/YER057c/UK114 family)